ncbi:MAG: TolC family protein [Limisphaerales bacterium]
MKSFCIVSAIVFAAFAAAAQTDTNAVAGRAMSLADCIQEAVEHNLDVQVERYEPQISLYNLNSAYGGYDPTLNFSGQHDFNVSGGGFTSQQIAIPATTAKSDSFNTSLSGSLPTGLQYSFNGNVSDRNFTAFTNLTESSGGSIGVSLTQPLLRNFWIDNTRLTIRVAKNRVHYSEQGLAQQLTTTILAVQNAYYELIFAQENVKVQQQALELAQTQLDQDKQRVQVGSLAPLDVQQDEAQVASSKANLISAQYALSVAQNTLKNLLTDTYSQWHDTSIEPTATLAAQLQPFDLQDSWEKGMSKRPDLLQARLDVEQQGIQLKFAKNQLFPELDLIGSYGFNGTSREYSGTFGQFNEGNQPFYSYGAQLSIPLSNARPRNQYKIAKATKEQILLRLKQLEQNVMVQIDNAVKQAQAAFQSADATRQARIYAEAALDAEQQKYAVGKSTTFTVLQLQNNLTAARSQEIRALADYNQALANLAAQEGTTLESNGIQVEAVK